MAGKNDFGYAGIGIAMETLIESAVRVTITHSDSKPIASEAATASVSRDEATGAGRPLKPAAPDDLIMGRNPSMRGRITPATARFCRNRWQYWGGSCLENGKMAAIPV